MAGRTSFIPSMRARWLVVLSCTTDAMGLYPCSRSTISKQFGPEALNTLTSVRLAPSLVTLVVFCDLVCYYDEILNNISHDLG